PPGPPGRRHRAAADAFSSRPVTISGSIRTYTPSSIGIHEVWPSRASRSRSAGSVTTAALPVTTTLQPDRVSAWNSSASKATTTPSTARTRSEDAEVHRITDESVSREKLTGSTAGRACRVYTTRPTGAVASRSEERRVGKEWRQRGDR